VKTLLSHYFQPSEANDLRDAALKDWVSDLLPFSQQAIRNACDSYRRDQPRRRPTPGDIRQRCVAYSDAREDRASDDPRLKLSHDELQLLEQKVLPTARRWVLEIPGLREHGEKTLAYWGEPVPATIDPDRTKDHHDAVMAKLEGWRSERLASCTCARCEAARQEMEAAE